MHEHPNVVMSPHIGGGRGLPGVEEARAAALEELVEAIAMAASQVEAWPTPVDLAAGY